MRRPLSLFLALSLLLAAFALGGCGKDDNIRTVNSENNSENNGTNNTNSGRLKGEGETCVEGGECQSGTCRLGTCTTASCIDGQINGTETDIDCGGVGCQRCELQKSCGVDTDCVSAICEQGTCVESRCDDNDQNGLESDVDCGGLFCDQCADGLDCREDVDCVSLVCDGDTCIAPTCDDRTKNADETDVDCGGPDCEPCADGLACSDPAHCISGVCDNGVCATPTCDDSVLNGDETDVDCGTDCPPCADGLVCDRDQDCVSAVCDDTTTTCSTPTCDDDTLNGNETDVDCGGPDCAPCDPRDDCLVGTDCVSGICDDTENTCTSPTCTDFVQNGEETATDCGGSQCGGCADGRACSLGSDCVSLVCQNQTCQPSACSDGQMNGTETDVDCGGSCGRCADGEMCSANGDCLSNNCSNTCRAAACTDGIQNGNETDVDCGGDCPNACDTNEGCQFDSDCINSVCSASSCAAPTCNDGVANGEETDRDCGGPTCSKCRLGQVCDEDSDCSSDECDGGQLGPICAVCRENQKQQVNQNCGYKGRGRVEQTCQNGQWVNTGCLDVYYRSCAEILDDDSTTPDGDYRIDPDGDASLYNEFEVFCDMTTDGGGWTEVTACIADRQLNAVVVAVDPADTARGAANCSYQTQDEGDDDHTYHMTFDFPAGITEFYLQQYEIRATGVDQANTSDLGFIQASWTQAAFDTRGDISFGSATQAGPITSFSRYTNTSCFDCVISWPGQAQRFNVNQTTTKFRIGWGEAGPQTEGWDMWFNGAIFVR